MLINIKIFLSNMELGERNNTLSWVQKFGGELVMHIGMVDGRLTNT